MERRIAKIAVSRCNHSERMYGVRMEKGQEGWTYNWAFKLNSDTAKREKYTETSLEGMLIRDSNYPGCPYCGANYFIVCGDCGKLSCNNAHGEYFTCGWCGMEGKLKNYSGDGFKAGGDR